MRIYWIFFMLLLTACYGANNKTTEIGVLNTDCINSDGWDRIKENYPVNIIEDSIFLSKVTEIENMHFNTEILYFKSSPKELIAISSNHYSVRYVYNPNLSTRILNGLSNGFDDSEMKRIVKRVQKVIIEYQCEEGKKKSEELMKTQW